MAFFEVVNGNEAAKLKIKGRPDERASAQQKVTSSCGIDGGSTLWYDGICGGMVVCMGDDGPAQAAIRT